METNIFADHLPITDIIVLHGFLAYGFHFMHASTMNVLFCLFIECMMRKDLQILIGNGDI